MYSAALDSLYSFQLMMGEMEAILFVPSFVLLDKPPLLNGMLANSTQMEYKHEFVTDGTYIIMALQ